MISNGSAITFDVQGTTGSLWPRTVASLRQDAIDGLTPFFEIADLQVSASSLLSDPFVTGWAYRATVRVTVQADYADIRDLDAVVAHAFYVAGGELPTVTANGYEAGQGAADTRAGLSLTTALLLVAVALVAAAVIKAGL